MFKRTDKRFDIFLARDFILLKADLKCIHSKNPDTIGKRIKEGSSQATRLIIDIQYDISTRDLIIGLKTGCERNKQLAEIILFYNSKFYRLEKSLILSKNIHDALK